MARRCVLSLVSGRISCQRGEYRNGLFYSLIQWDERTNSTLDSISKTSVHIICFKIEARYWQPSGSIILFLHKITKKNLVSLKRKSTTKRWGWWENLAVFFAVLSLAIRRTCWAFPFAFTSASVVALRFAWRRTSFTLLLMPLVIPSRSTTWFCFRATLHKTTFDFGSCSDFGMMKKNKISSVIESNFLIVFDFLFVYFMWEWLGSFFYYLLPSWISCIWTTLIRPEQLIYISEITCKAFYQWPSLPQWKHLSSDCGPPFLFSWANSTINFWPSNVVPFNFSTASSASGISAKS